MVEDGHLVELTADLLGDRIAALGHAVLPGRVEPGLEQPDQEPRDGPIGPQHPLHVVLAEPHPGLPQVLRAGPQQGHLAPAQARRQYQRVETVVFRLALPQGGERVLEDLAFAAGCGDGRDPKTKFIYPERTGVGTSGKLIRMLVDDLETHVLQLRQHIRQRYRRSRPVHQQRPPLRVLHQPHREFGPRLTQLEHRGEIADRVLGGDVRLVRLGNARPAQVEDRPGPVLAEQAGCLGGEILIPRPDRRGQPALEGGRVHARHRPSLLRPDHHVQAGQGRVTDGGAVVHGNPVQRVLQDALRAQPDLGGVPVPR